MSYFLPNPIKKCIETLENNGFEAYCVGGAVRDLIMGKTPYDYDITTSAMPEEIISCFDKTVPTGIKHGTVTVIIDNYNIEVTTYRSDGEYINHRQPETVNFVKNINEDLSRRDFTINAICYNPKTNTLDLFSGQSDIKNKIIRTVGNPDVRFTEDALRIMRCFRFSCQLGFSIEENTLNSALKLAKNLDKISSERIYTELKKILLSPTPSKLIPLINNGGFKKFGINNISDEFILADSLPASLPLRTSFFCKTIGLHPNNLLTNLCFNNDEKSDIISIYNILDIPLPNSKTDIKKMLKDISFENLKSYFKYRDILFNENCDNTLNLLTEIIEHNEPYKISMLALNGDDLIAFGYKGKEIGIILNEALDIVINNPKSNTKNQLLIKLNIK